MPKAQPVRKVGRKRKGGPCPQSLGQHTQAEVCPSPPPSPGVSGVRQAGNLHKGSQCWAIQSQACGLLSATDGKPGRVGQDCLGLAEGPASKRG